MAQDYLTAVAVLLLLGTLVSALAYELKISNIAFLIFVGMVFAATRTLAFPPGLIITVALIGLILVVFESASKLKFKEVIKYSPTAIKSTIIFLIFNTVFLAEATYFMFFLTPGKIDMHATWICILFAVLMFGIDIEVVLTLFKGKKNWLLSVLELESIYNTPITIIIPFTILTFISTEEGSVLSQFTSQILPFLIQIVVAVIIGVIMGWMIVHVLKKTFFGNLSYLALITSAIISYVLTEHLGGNGVIAVTIFGLFFGNYQIKNKLKLENFAGILASTLEIMVFISIGTLFIIHGNVFTYIVKASYLFIIHVIVRFITVHLTYTKQKLSLEEKLFLSMNIPKGVDVAIVILFMFSSPIFSSIRGVDVIINLSLVFTFYSVILSTALTRLAPRFIGKIKEV